MDEKLILKILSAIPPDGLNIEKSPVEGITGDMLYALREHGLLRRPIGEECYYITVAGTEWIRKRHHKKQATKIACATLVVTALGAFFAAVAAFPTFQKFGEWILKQLQ